MDIILYTPGTGGNMVAATIDNRGYVFDDRHYELVNTPDRIKLRTRRFIETMTDQDRDDYISDVSKKYKAIASHLLDYHISRKHSYILIYPETDEEIQWAHNRFLSIHPQAINYPATIEDQYYKFLDNARKHTDKIITLSDIRSGNLLNRLREYVTSPLHEEIYYDWLAKMGT